MLNAWLNALRITTGFGLTPGAVPDAVLQGHLGTDNGAATHLHQIRIIIFERPVT